MEKFRKVSSFSLKKLLVCPEFNTFYMLYKSLERYNNKNIFN